MRSCPHCRSILPDSAIHCPADGYALGKADRRIGALLSGQYQLLERVGEGASGEVYRAYQVGVERQVAIKILSSGAASSSEFVARFLREAQAAARLSHANIITVFHIGRTEDSLPFIAMEWIEGGPLGRGPQHELHESIETITEIAKQIASALVEAHGAGIVHRDLKPDNLLVSFRGGSPVVTIVDFGIAKVFDGALLKPGETHLTQLGTVYGTPQYLSPEQACGKPVDARSDIYSLGVVLYQLVSGRLPFTSKGVALLVDHINSDAPSLLSLSPETPGDLASLIMSMLAKDPSLRPQSACELEESLWALSKPGPSRASAMLASGLAASTAASIPATLVDTAFLGETHLLGETPLASKPRGSRSLRVPLAAAAVCLSLLALGSGELGGNAAQAHSVAALEETAASEVTPAPTFHLKGPQRALMVSADGYALRVLIPEDVRAESQQPMAIEVWDRMGRPVALPSLVVLFADEAGASEGVSVPSGTTLGRYELFRHFNKSGAYSMQVLTEDSEVALRVHFDVGAAASPPNS